RLSGLGGQLDLGPAGQVVGLVEPLALVLAGRDDEAARSLAELSQFSLTPSTAVARAVRALEAELSGKLDDVGPGGADGLADALALRARARHGDRDAWVALRDAAEELAAPGLLLGMSE